MVERTEETLPAQVAIKSVRIGLAVSLRFPEEGSSAQGQSVPKPRPKGVGDGKQVNIPAPVGARLYDGVTQKDRQSARMEMRGGDVGGSLRQIRGTINTKGSQEVRLRPNQLADSTLPRKTSKECSGRPYRKPTLVDGERILRRVRERSLRNSAN